MQHTPHPLPNHRTCVHLMAVPITITFLKITNINGIKTEPTDVNFVVVVTLVSLGYAQTYIYRYNLTSINVKFSASLTAAVNTCDHIDRYDDGQASGQKNNNSSYTGK